MGIARTGLTEEQRTRLTIKGKLLYGKFCGTRGRSICAEGFALYHLWRGEPEVALDLLSFLEAEMENLEAEEPAGRLGMTKALASRLRHHLEHEAEEPPDPTRWAAILKAKKERS